MEAGMRRLDDVRRFYDILEGLRARTGVRRLANCDGRMDWPERGVYFFFEDGEERSTSGEGPRVVRVGTHAITATSRTTLWDRLSAHRGSARSRTGNHRGSIFRLIVGEALIQRGGWEIPSWGEGGSVGEASQKLGLERESIKAAEQPLEEKVSSTIGAMPLLWVAVPDAPSTESQRGFIERNSIALLSNVARESVDPASNEWLGLQSHRERVRSSGLWNNNHVEETYDPGFLDRLADLVKVIRAG